MKRSSIAPLAILAVLTAVAAGCGGRSEFTPQSPIPGAQPDQQMQRLGAPLGSFPDAAAHSSVFTVNNTGYAPFYVFGYGTSANGDVAPSTFLGGTLAKLVYPHGLALDHRGYAYVGESNPAGSSSDPYAVAVYASPVTGDKAPVATIAGSRTLLEGTAVAVTEQGAVYVANEYAANAGYITIFAPGADGNVAPSVLIYGSKTLIDQPVGVAVGPTGKIYVANLGGSSGPATVTIFADNARGNIAPIDHFNLALSSPTAIAVDKTGAVYVASSASGGVWVYPAGSHAPRAILGDFLRGTKNQLEPFGIAVDASGLAYVANDAATSYSTAASQILVYPASAANSSTPIAVIAGSKTGLSDAKGVAVAPIASAPTPAPTAKPTATPTPTPTAKPTATPSPPPASAQAAYLADTSSKSLLAFSVGATGSSTALVDIAGSNTYLQQATSAFADSHGNMWVAEQVDSTGSSAVLEWKPGANGNATPYRRIYGQGPNGASDVVVDDAGNIYVLETNENTVAVFAPTANGQANPVRTFTASAFNGPISLELDLAQKNLYVTNNDVSGTSEILVFPVTSKGTVAPHVITTTAAPQGDYMFSGLGFDRSGNLYVAGSPQGSFDGEICELPAGKTGNLAALRVIDDSYGSFQPTGVGIDATGLVYVANFPDLFGGTPEAIKVYKPGSATAVRTITNAGLKIPGLLRVGPYVK